MQNTLTSWETERFPIKKLLIHDPAGKPKKGLHNEWYVSFVAESIRQKLNIECQLCLDDLPNPTNSNPNEFLLLVARTDGKTWPDSLDHLKNPRQYLDELAQWVASGRVLRFGDVPPPTPLVCAFDPTAAHWAKWFSDAWGFVHKVDMVQASPTLLIGDNSVYDFAQPGDFLYTTPELSPFNLHENFLNVYGAALDGLILNGIENGVVESRPFSSVKVCIGRRWVENLPPDWVQNEADYLAIYSELEKIKKFLDDRNIPLQFIEPACLTAPTSMQAYARYTISYAQQIIHGEGFVPLPEGQWQDQNNLGVTAKQHLNSKGDIAVKSRSWTPDKTKLEMTVYGHPSVGKTVFQEPGTSLQFVEPAISQESETKVRMMEKISQESETSTPTRESSQHKRSKKKVDETREYDKTQLRGKTHGHQVHRDYAAHFFRWSWAQRFCPGKKVLDTGCGQDLPLYKILMAGKAWLPELYVGVDLNVLTPPTAKWAHTYGEFNLVERWREVVNQHGQFDLVTSFEVIEHMTIAHGDEYLNAIWQCLNPGGALLISTPVFNGSKAANHVYEYTAPELREKLERAGYVIEERFGTFASANDIKKCATPEEKALIEVLARFHSNEVMACFLAPKYPDYSRNNVWLARKPV